MDLYVTMQHDKHLPLSIQTLLESEDTEGNGSLSHVQLAEAFRKYPELKIEFDGRKAQMAFVFNELCGRSMQHPGVTTAM